MANRPDNEVELDRLELRFAATRVSHARAVQRLVQSIDACGQLIECIAVGQPQPTQAEDQGAAAPLVLIDGYRRVAALRKLGRDTALVECWSCTVAQALARVLARSRSRAFTPSRKHCCCATWWTVRVCRSAKRRASAGAT